MFFHLFCACFATGSVVAILVWWPERSPPHLGWEASSCLPSLGVKQAGGHTLLQRKWQGTGEKGCRKSRRTKAIPV